MLLERPGSTNKDSTLHHGHHHSWAMDAVFSERIKTMAVIMLGAWMLGWRWMLFSHNGLDHVRNHGWAMDAVFSDRVRPWTSSWLGPECPLLRTDNIDHGHHHS